jgi:mono/diheme cytochrome c family protein
MEVQAMKRRFVQALFAGISTLLICQSAAAQARFDLGKWEYDTHCASCHGLNGKGAGPFTPFLKKPPSDLTGISRMNGGVFPVDPIYQIIDGRQEVMWHGPRDMPIWGSDYLAEVRKGLATGMQDSETSVRFRIMTLVDYLNRIQVR